MLHYPLEGIAQKLMIKNTLFGRFEQELSAPDIA